MFNRKKGRGVREGDALAFLGHGVDFKGILTYDGTVRIDGKFDGKIVTSGTLIVGETGLVTAEITAASVVCGGKIDGKIDAQKTIRLQATARVTGKLRAPKLEMESGATFSGQSEMTGETVEELSPAGLRVVGEAPRAV